MEYNPVMGDHFVVEVTVRSIFDEYGRFPDPLIMMLIWLGETESIMYDGKMLDVVEVPIGKKAIFFSPRGNR